MSITQKPLQQRFFFGLLFLVSTAAILTLQPYLLTMAVAATFAVVLQPLHRALVRICKGHRILATLLTVVITIALVLAPLSLIVAKIAQEAAHLYRTLSSGNVILDSSIIQQLEDAISAYIPQFDINIESYAGQIFNWIAGNLGSLFAGTFETIIQLLIGFVIFFYLLRDGPIFVDKAVKLSPLSDENDRKILDRLQSAINSIIKGNLTIALIQGISSGVGMAIFGVPSATLWGSIAAMAALIPSFGTSAVLLPAVAYLYFTGHSLAAIGLAIWAATAVGLIDNLLGPILVGRGAKMHPLWILLAVLGGLQLFGPTGFLVGPLVLSLLYALLDIYQDLFISKKGEL